MNKDKLTFFENIYYWILYCLPRPRQNGMDPASVASFLLSLLKIFNGLVVFFLLLNLPPVKFLYIAIGEQSWILTVVLLGIFGLVVLIQSSNCENKLPLIIDKIKKLTPKQKRIRILIFILYVVSSVILMFFIPTLESMGIPRDEIKEVSIDSKPSDSTHFDFEKYRHKYEQK